MADRTRSSAWPPRPPATDNPVPSSSSSSSVLLPGPRRFVSSLFGAVPRPPPVADAAAPVRSSNPLNDDYDHDGATAAAATMKNLFLALHVIFPNELLPALDVLDRGLVLRLRAGTTVRDPSAAGVRGSPTLLLVRSAQQRQRQQQHKQQQQQQRSSSSHRHPAAGQHVACYEVRLDAWSCSCPAFAFSAFPAATARRQSRQPQHAPERAGRLGEDDDGGAANAAPGEIVTTMEVDDDGAGPRFGGLSRRDGDELPVCKHLLACVLVERCAAFAHLVEEREVSEGELAGWAAGWGD